MFQGFDQKGRDSMKKVTKTEAEWKTQLSDEAYQVTRHAATERPYSHDDFPTAPGRYRCTCCGAELFEQTNKFDAGCGWPSFDAPLVPENIGESRDASRAMVRTEVHCNTCAAHLGHVFDDGPTETGLRYCINGVALDFEPKLGTKE